MSNYPETIALMTQMGIDPNDVVAASITLEGYSRFVRPGETEKDISGFELVFRGGEPEILKVKVPWPKEVKPAQINAIVKAQRRDILNSWPRRSLNS